MKAVEIFLINKLGSPPAFARVIIKAITVPNIPIVGAYPPILVKTAMFESCLSFIAFNSSHAKFSIDSASLPSIAYPTSFLGNT